MGSLIQFPQPAYRVDDDEAVNTQTYEKVYVVTRDDWDKPCKTHVIGYAAGDPAVIKAFYDSDEYKNVQVRTAEVRQVTLDMLTKKQMVSARKSMLLRELGRLERSLTEDEL